jgi:23S rRNA (cytidine1920-2'-O)/16S rRNA (cytidine1409-2'-O)-methyltransferase
MAKPNNRHPSTKRKMVRIDDLLLDQGLFSNREDAQFAISRGLVKSGETTVKIPNILVNLHTPINLISGSKYASRAGYKLQGFIDQTGLEINGKKAVDIGASNGGFTDCLIKNGASKVYAVDVGYGQLAWELQQSKKITVLDRTNARFPIPIQEKLDLAFIDVSFISLTLILPNIIELLKEDGSVIALIKPQFEAAKKDIPLGGVVKNSDIHAKSIKKIFFWGQKNSLELQTIKRSSLAGTKGNTEFFISFKKANIHLLDPKDVY